MRHVNPDLMRPARLQDEPHKRSNRHTLHVVENLQDLIVRHRVAPGALGHNRDFDPVLRRPGQRRIHHTFGPWRHAPDECQIRTLQAPIRAMRCELVR